MTIKQPPRSLQAAPFWEGAARGELRIQRCMDCGKMRFYPTEACPLCASTAFQWSLLSGRGQIYSWTVVHRSVDPEWQARAPYVAAIVEIQEQAGVLIPGLLTDVADHHVRVGMDVQVWFETMGASSLPRWRPAAGT